MHIADVVAIDDGCIHLNRSLLSTLHMQNKSSVYGLYYPDVHTEKNENYMFEHDFMFTPIPPRLWHSVARFVILIKHIPGCIAEITKYLADNDVNIVTIESTRAGHRFMYVTITVEFEKLTDKKDEDIYKRLSDDSLKKKQKVLREHIKSLKHGIKKNCKKYLFHSKHGIEPFEAVEGHIIHSLQYFYYKVGQHRNEDRFKPFMATIDQCKIEFIKEDWRSLWNNLIGNEIPTYGFATSSTRDLCLRVCLLDKDKLRDFSIFDFSYETKRTANKFSSKGLIGIISNELQSINYNIWSIYNTPKNSKNLIEDGMIKVVAQGVDKKNSARIDHKKNVKSIEENVNKQKIGKLLRLKGRAQKLSRMPIFVSVRRLDVHKQDYKKLFYKAGKEFGLLESDFVFFDSSMATKDISNAVISAMEKCSAMIQIHNLVPNTERRTSVWLESECLLAKTLGIPYTILIHSQIVGSLKVARESPYAEFKNKPTYTDIKQAINDVIDQKFGSIENM